MPEQKGIVLIGRGTLGCTVCLWAVLCSLGKKPPLTQTYHLCSVTSPADPGQPAVLMVLMKVLSRQKAESLSLKEVFFTKQWKIMFLCQRKKQKNVLNRRSTSPHKLHLFNSLQLTWALPLVVHCTAGTTSVASPERASSTFWVYSGHIFSSMRNGMCHKAHGSKGVGWKPTSTASSSMELPPGGCVLPFILQKSNKIIRFPALCPD